MPLQQRGILPHPVTLGTLGSAKRNALKTPARIRYFSGVKSGPGVKCGARPADMGGSGRCPGTLPFSFPVVQDLFPVRRLNPQQERSAQGAFHAITRVHRPVPFFGSPTLTFKKTGHPLPPALHSIKKLVGSIDLNDRSG